MNNQSFNQAPVLEDLLEAADQALAPLAAFYSTSLRLAIDASRGASRSAANAHHQLQAAGEQLREYAKRDLVIIEMLNEGRVAGAIAALKAGPNQPAFETKAVPKEPDA